MHLILDQQTGQLFFIDFNVDAAKAEEYEARWREIKGRYKDIRVYLNRIDTIGEMLPRYFAMCEENREEDTLYVTLPMRYTDRKRVANAFANEYTGLCDGEELDFWAYILKEHRGELNEDIGKFLSRSAFPTYFCKANSIKHHFTDEQVERGEEALRAMGVTGPFVCLAARTPRFNTRTGVGEFEAANYRSRNMDFKDYSKTIAWLGEQGIQCVKMSRFEDPMDPIPNCIDYSALHASDFMDLYTFSRCAFAVTCASGISTFANLFAKPLLMINAAMFSFGFGASRYTEHDRFLTKVLYVRDPKRRRIKRFLTFREVFETEKRCSIFDEHLTSRGIEWRDNTEDEILDAVKEIMARLDGTWTDTEEDEKLLERWRDIYEEIDAFQRHSWAGGPLPCPPAATFLRRHSFLLE